MPRSTLVTPYYLVIDTKYWMTSESGRFLPWAIFIFDQDYPFRRQIKCSGTHWTHPDRFCPCSPETITIMLFEPTPIMQHLTRLDIQHVALVIKQEESDFTDSGWIQVRRLLWFDQPKPLVNGSHWLLFSIFVEELVSPCTGSVRFALRIPAGL